MEKTHTLVIEIPLVVNDEDYFKHAMDAYVPHAVSKAVASMHRSGPFDQHPNNGPFPVVMGNEKDSLFYYVKHRKKK